MTFRWDQPMPDEWPTPKQPSAWLYLALFLIIGVACLTFSLTDWLQGQPVTKEFVSKSLLAPLALWVAACFGLYTALYDAPAYQAAVRNRMRWHLLTCWQQQLCMGLVVLDSTVLTPEPDLAERMLKLEGKPPENPGRCMTLGTISAAAGGAARVRPLLEALLTPLAARLAKVAASHSFGIVMQCDSEEYSSQVLAVWAQLKLPGRPHIRWVNNNQEPDFAHGGFGPVGNASHANHAPDCQLVLAWHLNREGEEPATSEAAVALLLGSPALLRDAPDLEHQAWLLRQRISAADQVGKSLALLLGAQQVPREHIRHFWHARLEGLARHATLGALKDADPKLDGHALDQAIGPQAPVARWVLQALAVRMVMPGQDAQLLALPHGKDVALNLVVKTPAPERMPWKEEYEDGYGLFPVMPIAALVVFWAFLLLVFAWEWNTLATVITCVMAGAIIFCVVDRFIVRRLCTDDVLREYGGENRR